MSNCKKVEVVRIYTLLLLISLLLTSTIAISFKEFRKISGNDLLMLVINCLVTVLNLYSYYQNPERLSNESNMYQKLNISYKKLNVYTSTISFTLSCITLFSLSQKFTSSYNYIATIISLIFILGQMFIWIVYHSDAPIIENKFKVLPTAMLCKKARIFLNSSILMLDIFKGWQEFVDEDEISPITSITSLITKRFGGWGSTIQDHLLYLLRIGSVIGEIVIDVISLDATVVYKPSDYNLPENVQ